jgi:hypothetical protein
MAGPGHPGVGDRLHAGKSRLILKSCWHIGPCGCLPTQRQLFADLAQHLPGSPWMKQQLGAHHHLLSVLLQLGVPVAESKKSADDGTERIASTSCREQQRRYFCHSTRHC